MVNETKLDLYKAHKADYKAAKKPVLLKIERAQYLIIDGTGRPGGDEFIDCIATLYACAFTVKMTYKQHSRDYTVCKLEAIWQIDNNKSFADAKPDEIHYKLMIRTPDFIKDNHLKDAQNALATRGKAPRATDVKLEEIYEGHCVQMLHVGPYDQENITIDFMTEFSTEEGYSVAGDHHEIYLSDPRRVEPERLRTILRLPVKKVLVSK